MRALSIALSLCTLSTAAVAAEPGLAGRNDIVLEDDFEQPIWYQAWSASSEPQNTSIVSDGSAFRGNSHLRVSVPKGSHYGTSFGFDFEKEGVTSPAEVYFRYAIRLGPTWTTDGGGGGKLPGFGATYGIAGWGGKPADGTNGWSARGLFWQPSAAPESGDTRIGYYVYHADMTGQYGANWFWSGGSLGSDGVLERSKWYEIEVYVKNNTPTQNDGVLRAWADGTQVYEKTDIRFRDVANLEIERVWFDIYYGGSWSAPEDMYLDFDNAVIAWNYIGPTSETPPTPGTGGAAGNTGAGGVVGSGGTGTAGGGGGGAGAGGVNTATPASDDDGGCGCRVGLRPPRAGGLALALLAVFGLIRRRR
jgi:MYXO-CTERM domain-containing protein